MKKNSSYSIVSSININSGKVFLREDDIIVVDIKEDYFVELKDLKEINLAIEDIARGRKHAIIIIVGVFTNISQEAIKDAANPENFKYTLVDAYIIKSTHQRLLANFYVKIMKPPVPTQYFEKMEDAEAWIHLQLKNK